MKKLLGIIVIGFFLNGNAYKQTIKIFKESVEKYLLN